MVVTRRSMGPSINPGNFGSPARSRKVEVQTASPPTSPTPAKRQRTLRNQGAATRAEDQPSAPRSSRLRRTQDDAATSPLNSPSSAMPKLTRLKRESQGEDETPSIDSSQPVTPRAVRQTKNQGNVGKTRTPSSDSSQPVTPMSVRQTRNQGNVEKPGTPSCDSSQPVTPRAVRQTRNQGNVEKPGTPSSDSAQPVTPRAVRQTRNQGNIGKPGTPSSDSVQPVTPRAVRQTRNQGNVVTPVIDSPGSARSLRARRDQGGGAAAQESKGTDSPQSSVSAKHNKLQKPELNTPTRRLKREESSVSSPGNLKEATKVLTKTLTVAESKIKVDEVAATTPATPARRRSGRLSSISSVNLEAENAASQTTPKRYARRASTDTLAITPLKRSKRRSIQLVEEDASSEKEPEDQVTTPSKSQKIDHKSPSTAVCVSAEVKVAAVGGDKIDGEMDCEGTTRGKRTLASSVTGSELGAIMEEEGDAQKNDAGASEGKVEECEGRDKVTVAAEEHTTEADQEVKVDEPVRVSTGMGGGSSTDDKCESDIVEEKEVKDSVKEKQIEDHEARKVIVGEDKVEENMKEETEDSEKENGEEEKPEKDDLVVEAVAPKTAQDTDEIGSTDDKPIILVDEEVPRKDDGEDSEEYSQNEDVKVNSPLEQVSAACEDPAAVEDQENISSNIEPVKLEEDKSVAAKKHVEELEEKLDQIKGVPRGMPVSGRFWKTEKKRFRTIFKDATGKKKWAKKMQIKREREDVLARSSAIKAEKQKKREEVKERQKLNKLRREENAKKAEIVQVIKDPRKLKKMKKKQLKQIKTADTVAHVQAQN